MSLCRLKVCSSKYVFDDALKFDSENLLHLLCKHQEFGRIFG
ncbi:hypothetical protein Ga0080574_TMP753 [Salipiger abyssi]|uniref:Uncharacterized protein n=1 Tax=Salipiger abyssi TaxID=1250539 RepID=A0A1P8UP00_9RHOB|nr:hypothetical protein Ga0080574_TMP753 [Salipiger abyssi]